MIYALLAIVAGAGLLLLMLAKLDKVPANHTSGGVLGDLSEYQEEDFMVASLHQPTKRSHKDNVIPFPQHRRKSR